MQKHANLVDLVKSFPTSIHVQNLGFDTAENEPLKVHLIIQPRDLIFTEPPRPVLTALLVICRRAGDDNLRIALRAG